MRLDLLVCDALFAGAQIGLVAIGFGIVYRVTRHIHFAYAALWTFVAYVYGSRIDAGDSPATAFAACTAVAIVLSLACLLCYRRVRGEFALVLSSFGIYLALLGVQSVLWGPTQTGVVTDGALGRTWLVEIAPGQRLPIPVVYIAHLAAAVVAALLLAWVLGRTATGASAMSVSDNRDLAVITGVRVHRVDIAAYVLSAVCAAISASIQVSAVGSDPYTGTELFVEALAVVILAGPVVVKVLVAAMLFGVIRSFAQALLGTEFVTLATYLVLLLMIVLRPSGLFSGDWVWERGRGGGAWPAAREGSRPGTP